MILCSENIEIGDTLKVIVGFKEQSVTMILCSGNIEIGDTLKVIVGFKEQSITMILCSENIEIGDTLKVIVGFKEQSVIVKCPTELIFLIVVLLYHNLDWFGFVYSPKMAGN